MVYAAATTLSIVGSHFELSKYSDFWNRFTSGDADNPAD